MRRQWRGSLFTFLVRFVVLVGAASCPVLAQQPVLRPLDMELRNYQYPFEVRHLLLNSQMQQLKMAYMDVLPEKPNGRSVLLLHGKNFNGAYWRETASALAAEGYRVIIPDQVGFGKSSKPQYYQYTFQQLALNTKTLLDTLGIRKVSVLGHSMGGMLATRFALMYPETTEKLILENPIGLEDWKRWVPYQPVEEWFSSELKQNYEGIRKYQLDNYYGGQWKPAYDEWVNLLAGWTLSPDYQRIAWNSALTYDMIFTQPVVYEMDQLVMPVLLLIGQRDKTALGKAKAPAPIREKLGNYPVLGRQTRDRIKKSKLVELEGVGHLPHIEAFDRFWKPLREFLAE